MDQHGRIGKEFSINVLLHTLADRIWSNQTKEINHFTRIIRENTQKSKNGWMKMMKKISEN